MSTAFSSAAEKHKARLRYAYPELARCEVTLENRPSTTPGANW